MSHSPDNAYSHAASTLRFDAVLGLVASRCVNSSSREEILALQPDADPQRIQKSLDAIAEFRKRLTVEGDIPIADTTFLDVMAEAGEGRLTLDPEELLMIAASERAADDVRRLLGAGADQFPIMHGYAARLAPHPELATAIDKAVDSDGSIKDSASGLLKSLRRGLATSRASLRRLTEELAGAYGDDTLTTMVNGRHALLVPRGKTRKKTGFVHSTSHTGGSLYFEPFKLVESNNELETMLADENAEVMRIIAELNAAVAEARDDVMANGVVMNELDVLRSKALFCERAGCVTPVSSPATVRLVAARHPTLERVFHDSGGKEKMVPLDLTLAPDARLMVITGPNAGGKTVTLKTLGTCCLMYQCGLQVPAASGSTLPVFDRIFVDIGDEQSLEASLSTFTSHLGHLHAMISGADENTLCLIDEIGDGTDPDEGAALAVATLERLLETGAAVVATTHLGRIKTFALKAAGVSNASMAFEADEGRPLYRLLQGIAGRSRGLETARRAGFDPDVVERAESYVGEEAFRLESVLSDLESSHLAVEKERAELAHKKEEIEALEADLLEKRSAYDLTRKEAERKAVREAQKLLAATRSELEQVIRDIRERQADKSVIVESRRRMRQVEDRLDLRSRASAEVSPLTSVAPGDRVALNRSGEPAGAVISVENDRVTVEINSKRITLDIGRLFRAAPTRRTEAKEVLYEGTFEPLASTTLDIRGRDREDALSELVRFIDRAVLAGVREVVVIHGIGTGVLARAVKEALQEDPRVETTRMGEQREGGAGVVVVQFK